MLGTWKAEWALLATLMLGLGVPGARAETQASPPNVVIILADDLGYSDVGAYGASKVATPNIDRLATEGMLFTDAHSPSSVCTPSRYNLLTGRYSWRTHAGTGALWDDPLMIDTARLTIASMLQANGYETGVVGKWHLGLGEAPANQADWRGIDWNGEIKPGPLEVGFDYSFVRPAIGGPVPQVYVEGHHVFNLDPADPIRTRFHRNYPGYLAIKRNHKNIGPEVVGGASARYEDDQTAIVETARATAFIDAHADGPFFLYFATHNVHEPVTPGSRFRGNPIGPVGDFIEELDWIVGEVMNALDRNGVTQNTLLFFTSDNGPPSLDEGSVKGPNGELTLAGHRRNDPWRGWKTEAYEGGHRVPLVVRWPQKIAPGSRSDALVALTDVLATSAELLEYPLPENAAEDSFSFLPTLLGTKPEDPQAARTSLVCDGWRGDYSIRQGRWKLILPATDVWDVQSGSDLYRLIKALVLPDSRVRTGPDLFDLTADPGERENVADEHPDVVARIEAYFTDLKRKGRSRP